MIRAVDADKNVRPTVKNPRCPEKWVLRQVKLAKGE
jgi:hypothetical protein